MADEKYQLPKGKAVVAWKCSEAMQTSYGNDQACGRGDPVVAELPLTPYSFNSGQVDGQGVKQVYAGVVKSALRAHEDEAAPTYLLIRA